MLYYQSGAYTQTGNRNNNQDNYYLNGAYQPEAHGDCSDEQSGQARVALFSVADGMGGENSGERASFLVVKQLSSIKETEPSQMPGAVSRAIKDANETLCAVMKKENSGRMGSTVVTLLIAGSSVYIANLGDSPAYLCRNSRLEKLTRDHTEGQAMLDGGVITKEQLAHHPSKNRLTRHLGIFASELELEVAQYDPIAYAEGDIFLLCSDGISGVLSDEQLIDCLNRSKSAADAANDIVAEALRNGSKDNCTALVVKFSSKPMKESRDRHPAKDALPTAEPQNAGDSMQEGSLKNPIEEMIEKTSEPTKTPQEQKPDQSKADHVKWKDSILIIVLLAAAGLMLILIALLMLMKMRTLR